MTPEIMAKKNVSISYLGTKVSKGIDTGVPCMVVGVLQKEDLRNLKTEDIIPKTYNGLVTDVIQAPFIKARTGCSDPDSTCYPHAEKYRPLIGGISFCQNNPSLAATLGMMVVDSLDDAIVGLTNNHVIGPVYDPLFSTPTNGITDPTTVEVIQPSRVDGGVDPTDVVGLVKRAVPIQFGTGSGQSNKVDAAICTLDGLNISAPGILDLILGGWYPFAEKYETTIDNTVQKAGRTTGNTVGNILTKNATVNVSYGTGDNNLATFVDQLAIQTTGRFSANGDSGAVVTSKILGQYKIIGLFFASNDEGTLSIVSHMDDVVSELNIESWNGTIYVPDGTADVIMANDLCYHDIGEFTTADPSHTPQRNFPSCERCLSDQSKRILFGTVA